ncbi:MAG TPA: hypothetical protein VFA26_08175 [Gemmataceae bacterium]|nr:hypothetical protein [Gemmataceae bacterium]
MTQLAPPPPPPTVPRVALEDGDDGIYRLRRRMQMVFWALATVLATVWVCTYGWVPAIIAVMIAKHILVAILVMGLGVDAKRQHARC